MAKLHLIIILLIVFGCKNLKQNHSHSKSSLEIQQENFKIGLNYLNRNKLEFAYNNFFRVNIFEQKSDLSKITRNKIDSILPIIKKEKIHQLQGFWKLKELHNNPYTQKYPDFIEFNNDKIIYYNSKKVIIREELVKYVDYEHFSLYTFNYNFAFKNSEVWSFNFYKKNGKKKLYPILEVDSLGTSWLMMNEITKNRKKETQTFYTRINKKNSPLIIE